MIEIMLAEVFIKAAILCLLLYLFARSEADFDFRKVSMVTAGLTLGSILLEGLLTEHLGAFVLIPIIALTVLMLMKFCWVSWWKALIITLPFVGVSLTMSLVAADITNKSSAALTRSMTRSATTKEDIEELKKLHGANTDLSFLDSPAPAPPPDKNTPALTETLTDKPQALAPQAGVTVTRATTPPAATSRRSAAGGKFNLTGISRGTRGRLAVINGEILEPGQTIDGATVMRIDLNRVVLSLNDELITLVIRRK